MIFFKKLQTLFTDPGLRKSLLFTALILALFRLGANIPIPGIDMVALNQYLSDNSFLGLLNLFSGGGLSNLSIFMLGVGPYITSTIILQLLTMVFPKLKEMYHEEGEIGRKKFSQYGRLFTIPLALVQGFGLLVLLRNQGVLLDADAFAMAINVIVVMGGSVLLMWMGELISEFGVGNGVSLLIFAGIVAGFPTALSQIFILFDATQIPIYIAFAVLAVVVTAAVVFITEAERPIPVTYAKRVRGMKMFGGVSTYLPLRLNQSGVMPIIFALAILLFPQMIGTFLIGINNSVAQVVGGFLSGLVSNLWLYGVLYFILVFLFTYFYTAVTFDPEKISENLQKSGAFIPGVRPGEKTSGYIASVLTRLTLVGALFLGFVAVLPLILQGVTGIQALTIGGTGLLIVVSVVLDVMKKVDAQLSMREY
ncbi:MAG: preprotein translocase subunit SecY [Candidatus Vogelbacteria bacterium CG10_big_fil_rev_8_21_14_0_10_45_14]|uniref:Protein translocase subunit SecY n=1 Tax=Candidatus Vogelbacteria bacterium CG10_big_fil_rev_8_21_14_0_10_45_14 TaxID=1975042 RepID=A0A2H0RLD5_9BACT|nr:MAG: preprotein translocase subunit SecY [Candidatus Vogelbacteria bacterium CG10_big_fil_rev_8_21_14_0_10_45_14]